MRLPFAPFPLLLFVTLLVTLITVVQMGALTLAFDKLGLSPQSGFLLLFASLLGSAINLPLFSLRAETPEAGRVPVAWHGLLRHPSLEFHGRTHIAINVGGGLTPVLFSLYLLARGSVLASACRCSWHRSPPRSPRGCSAPRTAHRSPMRTARSGY
jgi:uncharacterized membrane protein